LIISEIKFSSSDLEAEKQEVLQLFRALPNVGTADETKAEEPTFHMLFNSVRKMQVDHSELLTVKELAAKAKTSPSFKLERIKFTQFRNEMSDWQSHFDQFMSSVDKNHTLSLSQVK